MLLDNIIYLPVIFALLFFVFKKNKLLNENILFSKHKNLAQNKRTPIIIGGIYIYLILFFYFPDEFLNLKIFAFLILVIGIFSDKNFIVSPLSRLLLQIFILTFLISIDNLYIKSINIDLIDFILKYDIANIILTVFCFLVLINGSNFLDGLNGLLSGYFILIILSLIYIDFYNTEIVITNLDQINILLVGLLIFILFNFLGYSFLGDGGAYLISLILGYFLIQNYNNNIFISPYFVALMFWYPAFENLFSLSRRIYLKSKVSKPDNYHLHQLIFKFLTKKLSIKNLNSFTSLLILFYNLIVFGVSLKYFYHSKILISLILFNIFIYLCLYYFLSKNFVSKK